MTSRLKQRVEKNITDMSTRPLRCLALAVKEREDLPRSLQAFDRHNTSNIPLLRDPSKYRDIESGLTLVGIVGIKDPARPEVADSIEECSKADIRLLMTTGDARDAIAIAKDVNIFLKGASIASLKAYEGRD
jgi:P-type Ca2+ transporter type 2C